MLLYSFPTRDQTYLTLRTERTQKNSRDLEKEKLCCGRSHVISVTRVGREPLVRVRPRQRVLERLRVFAHAVWWDCNMKLNCLDRNET